MFQQFLQWSIVLTSLFVGFYSILCIVIFYTEVTELDRVIENTITHRIDFTHQQITPMK